MQLLGSSIYVSQAITLVLVDLYSNRRIGPEHFGKQLSTSPWIRSWWKQILFALQQLQKGYLTGLREWDEDSYVLTEVILEAQERFSRQIALQDLGEHRLDDLNDFDEEDW